MSVRIGISGWHYPPWRGVFYPRGLPQHRELEYAAGVFSSIEINGSFYSLQSPGSWRRWHDATPEDFVFAIKGPRFITHLKRLREIEKPLANFFASGLFLLQDKLGPFLWQFPPNMRYDPELFEDFLQLLPRNSEAASDLARRHDRIRMRGRNALTIDAKRRLRHAVEIRHESFCNPAFVRQLRHHDIALVVADTAGRWPFTEDVTADFLYLRLHGDKELYVSGYTGAALDQWADRIRAWSSGGESADARKITSLLPRKRRSRDVYCYFDNDAKVHAPFDAMNLARRLGVTPSTQPLEPAAKMNRRRPGTANGRPALRLP